jgi:hypothetical protein
MKLMPAAVWFVSVDVISGQYLASLECKVEGETFTLILPANIADQIVAARDSMHRKIMAPE